MPIVNRANYTNCPSCGRWLHEPPQQLNGNRALLCQDCYEFADKQRSSCSNVQFRAVAENKPVQVFNYPINLKDPTLDEAYACDKVHRLCPDLGGVGSIEAMLVALRKFVELRRGES